MGTKGDVFFLFGRKERTKEKSNWLFSRKYFLVRTFLGLAIYGKLPCVLALLDSPRASGVRFYPSMWLTLAIICIRFGIPRMIFSCLGSFPPRHVRHPSAAQMEARR